MTESSSTKQKILNVSLELFSTHGFEATSLSQIAEAVGIRKASLYSHFASKQAILDALLKITLEEYDKHSIFAKADWDNPNFTKDKENITPDMAIQMIIGQIHYILNDPQICQARKILTIEQFQNSQMADLLTKQNYNDVMKFFNGMIRFLISKGKLENLDTELMTAQFCLPISVWINLCDREPKRETEVMSLIERHVRHFFMVYEKNNLNLLREVK